MSDKCDDFIHCGCSDLVEKLKAENERLQAQVQWALRSTSGMWLRELEGEIERLRAEFNKLGQKARAIDARAQKQYQDGTVRAQWVAHVCDKALAGGK